MHVPFVGSCHSEGFIAYHWPAKVDAYFPSTPPLSLGHVSGPTAQSHAFYIANNKSAIQIMWSGNKKN